jgi:membrane-bound metal-dependent hydrolase YbcI (DUF457 family)
MPFTPSHAVAILPFLRTPLPAAALVIGSMAPDLQYFVPLNLTRSASHSWPGIVYIDIPIGIVALLLWALLLRAPVLDYSPRWLRERMAPLQRNRSRIVYAALVLAALAIGILTHLLLDLPTHRGWLSEHWAWMQGSVGPFTVIRILHFGVSVLGAVIIAVWAIGWVRRTPRTDRPTLVPQRERVAVWIALSTILVGTCLTLGAIGVSNGRDPLSGELWFYAFCTAAGVSGDVLIVICAVWWARKRVA